VTDFQPPPRICPACSAENLPFATTCRACAVDMRLVAAISVAGGPPGSAVRRPRGGAPAVAVAVVVLIALSLASVNLTGVVGRGHGRASGTLGSITNQPSMTPSASPPASPSPAPSPSEHLVAVGQPVALAGVETHTVLRVEDWSDATPAAPGDRSLAVEIQVKAMPGKTARFDQLYYTVQNSAGVVRNAPQIGRQPALAYGILAPGQSVVGWVSFLIPDPGPFVLNYRYPLGTNGQTADEAVVLDPILPPSPEPGVPAGPSPGSPSLPNFGYPTVLPSTNYSGYGAQWPGKTVSTVSGSWIQSAVRCSGSETSAVATWVGIDDGGVQDLEQVGTEALCRQGSKVPAYVAWYEMYPMAQVAVSDVRPGDHLTASVTKHGTTWTLAIRDITGGGRFSINQTRNSAALQALWVVEAPARLLANGDLQVLPLTRFNPISMSGCSAVVGGVRRVISDAHWAHYRFDMRTTSNTAKALTSGLAPGGTGFSSTWRHR
jgi:hypothetical protein